jgi:predicted metal-dependent hydrolase
LGTRTNSSFTQLVLGFFADPDPGHAADQSDPTVTLPNGRSVGYRIVLSARAKRLRLKLTPLDGLVIVAPKSFKRRRIERLVHGERHWIARHIPRMDELREHARRSPAAVRPESLELRAIGETWKLEAIDRNALKQRLRRRARETLVPWLERISEETGYRCAKVRIRGQRTRWGSCSTGRAISLNYQLLFLPPEWVRYILIHELCHTAQMNHSRAFWALVARHVPDVQTSRKALRTAWKLIPEWVSRGS